MSIRYGISLVLEPSFTAGLHRARQVICSQYGRWAAEMHAVHVPLTGYFPCQAAVVPSIEASLEGVAAGFRNRNPYTLVGRRGLMAEVENRGNIYVDLADAGDGTLGLDGGRGADSRQQSIGRLRSEVAATLAQYNLNGPAEGDRLRFALLHVRGYAHPGISQRGAVRRGHTRRSGSGHLRPRFRAGLLPLRVRCRRRGLGQRGLGR